MKKIILPAFVLALAISLAACRTMGGMDTEIPTTTQPTNSTTAATNPTVLPNPTIETNIPDPSVDTSMPMDDETTHNENKQNVG